MKTVRRAVSSVFGVLLTAFSSTGCGQMAADLFAIERTGTDQHSLRMVISDGGTVTCNSAKRVSLGSQRLLTARALTRDLEPLAKLDIALAPQKGSVYRYRLRHAAGLVSFADNSSAMPAVLPKLVAFSHDIANNICARSSSHSSDLT